MLGTTPADWYADMRGLGTTVSRLHRWPDPLSRLECSRRLPLTLNVPEGWPGVSDSRLTAVVEVVLVGMLGFGGLYLFEEGIVFLEGPPGPCPGLAQKTVGSGRSQFIWLRLSVCSRAVVPAAGARTCSAAPR